LSKAVAIQVVLIFESKALRHLNFKLIYHVLSAFVLGVLPSDIPAAAVERLRRFLNAKEQGCSIGLVAYYRERIKKRARDPALAGMDAAGAALHLLLALDREPLNFWLLASMAPGAGWWSF
jgi:hypothetical protein